jgi:hypothetical protein
VGRGIPNIIALRITILATDNQSSRLSDVLAAYLIEEETTLLQKLS